MPEYQALGEAPLGDIDSDILDAYFSGNCGPGDHARVMRWVGRDPARRALLDSFKRGLARGEDTLELSLPEEAWYKVNALTNPQYIPHSTQIIKTAGARLSRLRIPFGGANSLKIWTRAALGLTICAIAVLGVKYLGLPGSRPNTSPVKTYVTQPGQRAKVVLASGAQVILAPATTLKVTGNNVSLSGQAVFTVIHRGDKPFTVNTRNTSIRVLGTTFSVRSYADESESHVIVAEGKVSMAGTVLAPGDEARTSGTGRIVVRRGADIASALAWTQGELVFNETPLREAIPDLNRWYGIDINVTDESLLNRSITMTLDAESPGQAIDLIAQVIRAKATHGISGKSVTFTAIRQIH